MSDWSSEQYLKYASQRTRPAVDLMSRIDGEPKTILDIGCGPGNSTFSLRAHFKDSDITGVDSSDDMLEKARSTYPDMKFEKCRVPQDLDSLGQYDLIFSNACLHWVANHSDLFPQLAKKISNGGFLAVQMPLVQHAPFYAAVDRLVKKDEWGFLSSVKNFHNLLPEETYDILCRDFSSVNMWETVYYHIVESFDDIISWYKGSGLRPYLDLVADDRKEEFVNCLLDEIKKEFSVRTDGKIILKMPRMFFVAQR